MEERDKQAQSAKASGRAYHRARPIVLITEDSEDDYFLLHRAFKKIGAAAELAHCPDGAATVQYLEQTKGDASRFPGLLLLDLKLPGMTGFEVLTWCRKDAACKLLPVNVLSSSDEAVDVKKAFELGANAYTVKPMGAVNYEDLVAGVFKFWLELCELPGR